MIDTDKYEGHTEGPWKEVDFNWGERTSPNGAHIPTNDYVRCIKDVADVVVVNDGGTTDANWNLIKDAPLLLAEVIQLNKIIDFAWEVMDDQTAVEFNDLIKGLELESQWESEGILMGYCLGCSIPYPLEDMNKQRLCQECQEEVKE